MAAVCFWSRWPYATLWADGRSNWLILSFQSVNCCSRVWIWVARLRIHSSELVSMVSHSFCQSTALVRARSRFCTVSMFACVLWARARDCWVGIPGLDRYRVR